MNTTRILALSSGLASVVTATMLLTGCSPTGAPPAPSSDTNVNFEHVHELVAEPSDGTLLVATHEGLYRLTIEADGSATAVGPIGGLDFDPMGFTIADGIAYASGHPGPTTPSSFGNPNLGLITSTDLETWTNVSLTGQTDFHGLTVATSDDRAPEVFGYDASSGVLQRSRDGGSTWSPGAQLSARDILALDDQLYATTSDGLAISSDDGVTFTVDAAAPALYVVAADQSGTIAGVDTTGTIWTRAPGQDWTHGHTIEGVPQAFTVDGSRIFVADDRGIAYTDDAGKSWIVLQVHT
jgi:hypothetical protein